MVQALTMLLAITLAGSGADVDRGDRAPYVRAIDCAAGEATLAGLLGGAGADAGDRDTVAQINALSERWLREALVRAPGSAVVRSDLARSKAALTARLAAARDPAGLTAVLGAHLATCAVPPGTTRDPATIG